MEQKNHKKPKKYKHFSIAVMTNKLSHNANHMMQYINTLQQKRSIKTFILSTYLSIIGTGGQDQKDAMMGKIINHKTEHDYV